MTTTGGQPTNAVYGFASMLLKVLDEEKPDAVIVAFDGPRAELERAKTYPEYKAHRPSMPDELRGQIEMITHLLGHMRVPIVTARGFEADDVLGTLAVEVAGSGSEAVVVTGDRDTLQLVRPGVRILMTTKGITDTVSFDADGVLEKYGVTPEKLPDVAGLKGDPSDNIPGVPGIGEKGASALIAQYGSLENLYEHLEEVTGAKRKAALEDNREIAFLSRDLARLDTALELDVDPSAVTFADWDKHEVLDYLYALEFKTLAARFTEMYKDLLPEVAGTARLSLACALVDESDEAAVQRFVEEARQAGALGASAVVSGSGFCDVSIEAVALATEEKVLLASRSSGAAFKAALELLSSDGVEVWMHDAKDKLEALDKEGPRAGRVTFDTAIAAYLENPSLGTYRMRDIWERNLGGDLDIEGLEESEQACDQPSLLDEPVEDARSLREIDAAQEAARVVHLKPVLEEKLRDLEMELLISRMEIPLMLVLREMEETGVKLDPGILRALAEEASRILQRLETDIYGLAGKEFNIGSPRQLAQVLFEDLGLPASRRTKTGYSTDVSVLESLRESHEIAGKIIEYREYSKLKSTYFDVLPALVCERTGRLHCTFNQMSTTTGRISSSNPNLQNIPVRTEVGRRIREAFVPGESGWKMVVADYSQIELRVLAHMSEDPLLLAAFQRDADIHSETAARVFGVPEAEVTSEMRRMAKVVNFGVVYGMGYYGLSSRLGISMEEATAYIDAYFETYEGVRRYRDSCIEEATEKGYCSTLFGRRRFIPELASPNRQTRELGERLAINTPLQGTAADIIKRAMIDISDEIRTRGMASRMTVQIHDELMFDTGPSEVDALVSLVGEKMSGAADLAVKLMVDIGVYDNWGQAKQ
jgi:DNA polymerase I